MKKILVILCFLSSYASAETSLLGAGDLRLSYSRELRRAHFTIGSEFVNLSSDTASVLGAGPRAGFEYGLSDRWSMGTNVAFAFQATGKQGAFFYSSVNGTFRYALRGSAMKFTSIVAKKDGESVYVSKPFTQRRMTALIGMDQLFLNGATSIYPAVGATVGASYGFGLLDREAELEVRYSALTANDNPISMIAFSANINLDF
ncbi:hypothetical protein [Bdellovibrio sp. HCB337]|uniref:hypothetical protein n=1 Tax=Bdellovibrio sp. HCB337 TaxID=3394358 RepID=UPI0039A60B8F